MAFLMMVSCSRCLFLPLALVCDYLNLTMVDCAYAELNFLMSVLMRTEYAVAEFLEFLMALMRMESEEVRLFLPL
jgi:hypothetical protein